MRSAIILIVTFLLAIGAFVGYLYMQGDAPKREQTTVKPIEPIRPPASQPVASDNPDDQSIIKSGSGVWVAQRDPDTAELLRRFRAAQFDPLPNSDVRVTQPEAEFYLSDGQILTLVGTNGDVAFAGAAPGPDMKRGPSQTPTRGFLNDVTIKLFDNAEQYDKGNPSLTVTMPNASFDNDTFRIQTQSYTAPDGKTVPPEKVPITMRGVKYDFDGEGLVIKWNERDRRLESMRVAHGGQLTVKDLSAIASSDPATTQPTTRPMQLTRAVQATGDLLHFDFQMEPAGEDTTTTATTRRRRQGNRIYRATFNNDIKIVSTPAPTTLPSGAPATQPSAPQPIVITWNGPLNVVPLPADAAPREQRLAPGDTAIHLEGTPVVLTQEGSEIRAAKLSITNEKLTKESTLLLRRSDAFAVTMVDSTGAKIQTDSMDYSETTGRAVLRGPSRAEMPIDGQDPLIARWTEQAVMRMSGVGSVTKIQSARLEGDVNVQHPQLALTSKTLNLRFDPETAKEKDIALRELEADGTVVCEIKDANDPQSIAANHLLMRVDSVDGKLFPRRLNADGDVHTKDARQELWARELEVFLEPADSAKPQAEVKADDKVASVQLRRLRAHQNVRIVTKDGAWARADQLVVEATDGEPETIRLVGTPAHVHSEENSVTGPLIVVNPREGKSRVVGAGTMHAIQQETPESKPTPIDVSWSDRVLVDSTANKIEVEGDVHATSVDPDGTVTVARGRRLDMTLIDKPVDATAPAPVEKSEGLASMNMMENKQINTVVLREDVQIESVLASANGKVLRQMNLFTDVIDYQMPQQKMTIPGAGRMLYVDRQPPAKGNSGSSSEMNSSGATAFEWKDQLNYDQAARQMAMTGSVVIVHEPTDQPDSPVRMEADRVIAHLIPMPATQPSNSSEGARLQVERVIADGNLTFRGNDMLVIAEQMEFYPQTNLLIARGTDRTPAVLFNAAGIVQHSAEEIVINTSTWQLRTKNSSGSVRR